MSEPPRLEVLIVEDNPTDAFLLKEAFASQDCALHFANNGDAAMRYLLASTGRAGPDIVVLDLNLPGKDGAEILAAIRDHSALRDVFVTVVSSSPTDLMKRKAAQADHYISKNTDLDGFLAIGGEIVSRYRGRTSAV